MREAMATASALGVELAHVAVQERDRIALVIAEGIGNHHRRVPLGCARNRPVSLT
jgi:hypothetical protein